MSEFYTRFESLILWVLGLGAAAGVWVVRNIITNGKRLDLLEQQAKHSRQLREDDHEQIREMRADVKDLKNYMMENGK